jgi:glycosyltransferase involved in cell wall biosynthesis/SAM-dependent methyltransferase
MGVQPADAQDAERLVAHLMDEYCERNPSDEYARRSLAFDRLRLTRSIEWLSRLDLQHKRVLELGGYSLASHVIQSLFPDNGYVTEEFELRKQFPFPDASFDVLISMEVLEHICDLYCLYESTLSAVRSCLSESLRVLRPGGKMFLTTPNGSSIWVIQRALLHQPPWLSEYHFREFTVPELRALVEGAGFRIVAVRAEQVWHHWDFDHIKKFMRAHNYSLDDRGDDVFLLAEKPVTEPGESVRRRVLSALNGGDDGHAGYLHEAADLSSIRQLALTQSRQLAAKEQALETATLQLRERERLVQALTAQATEREEQLKRVAQERETLGRSFADLSAQHALAEQHTVAMLAQLEQLDCRTAELLEQGEALRHLSTQHAAAAAEAERWRLQYEWIVHSKSYRLAAPLRLLYRVLGSPAAAWHAARPRLGRLARRWLPEPIVRWLAYLRTGPSFLLKITPGQRVTLYTARPDLFPDFADRVSLTEDVMCRRPISLVATVKNEGATIRLWLDSIRRQTRRPDEIVITDGGSTDDTAQQIADYETAHRLGIRLIPVPGANVSTGRNLAIQNASHEIVAITDAGCDLDPHWLERLTAPFALAPETEVVAGFYEAQVGNSFERTVAGFTVPTLPFIDPGTFSPSSRSLAVVKTIWKAVGGYPEYLTLSGEDTAFNIALRRRVREWAFVPDALARWHVPASLERLTRTFYSWGRGDAEARIHGGYYVRLGTMYAAVAAAALVGAGGGLLLGPVGLVPAGLGLLLWLRLLRAYGTFRVAEPGARGFGRAVAILSAIHIGQLRGYWRGRLNRPAVEARRWAGIPRNFLLLAGIPIHDTGGGQRSAQLALELLRRGFKVTYVNFYPSYETRPVQVSYADARLDCVSFEEFDLARYLAEHRPVLDRTTAIVEFPLPAYLGLARELQTHGVRIVYDLMDDWNSTLGGQWYARATEDQMIASADMLVATALELQEELHRRAPGRPVLLMPNAMNSHLFDATRAHQRPPDLPEGRPVIGYVGSMYGEWFRADLVAKVAAAFPGAAIVLLGDHKDRFATVPANVHPLGLRAHQDVPAYVAHFDVCLIPFDPMPLIQATSPLKVFEYLAMGKPVVATEMRELRGMPGVFISRHDEEFIANIARALREPLDAAALHAFAQSHSWRTRVDDLLAAGA